MLETVLSSDKSSFDINRTDGLGNSALHIAYVTSDIDRPESFAGLKGGLHE